MSYTELKNCICCGNSNISSLLDLGNQPLANDLDNLSNSYPLKLLVCNDCYHCQLSVSVDPDILFSKYLYISGTSNTLKQYFKSFATNILIKYPNTKSILDIACNDGSQLKEFRNLSKNLELFGVDPAKNIVDLIDKNLNINVLNCFWPNNINKKFDIIIMQNVLAHTKNALEMLKCAKDHLTESGKIIVQTSQCNMFENGEFDTIYHEHISFFNLNSMIELCKQAGLGVVDCEVADVHGKSYVFTIDKSETSKDKLHRFNYEKNILNQYNIKYYDTYAKLVKNKIDLLKSINNYPNLIGLGAAAKGTVSLNSAEMYNVQFLLDESPLKIGKSIKVGDKQLDIFSLDHIDKNKSYNIIIFAWNFKEELISKLSKHSESINNYITIYPNFSIIKM